jgi:hypothetical protein
MTGRRQVWAGFTLLATAVVVWSFSFGLATTPSPALGLGAASLVATAMLVALRAVSGIALPLVLGSNRPIAGPAALLSARVIRWSAPDAPGRPRPRAPGQVPDRVPGPALR